MSSVPPNTPPGGGPPPPPYPPYDPRTNWRVYREQQKAAWRAQRDAWRTQRYAWKANYVNAYGPRIPSVVGPIILLAIGIVGLLIYSGRISAGNFWAWYGHWWPLLLIVAGLAMLGEWALDLRRTTPVRRGGSYVGLLILVAFVGLCASGTNHMAPWMNNWNNDNGDFFNMFGQPEHDNDLQSLNTQVPANSSIHIENPRGDVSISATDGSTVVVETHELAFADSDSDAKEIFDNEAPHLTVTGSTVTVKSGGNDHGRINLTVTVPKSARVTIHSGWGDVTAAGLGGGVDVTARGDIHVNSIVGPVQAHFVNGRHYSFSAHDVQGDLTLDGDVNDLTLSEIKGSIAQSGDIPGDVHIENVAGPVHLHTSVTDLQLASLPGDMTLDSDDLRVTEAKGAVHVTTHAKDVDLSQIYGDTTVEDRDGSVSVEPAGAYGVDARNSKGDVEVTLPPNGAGTVDGRTHNGDIVTEFGLNVSGDEDKTVTGRIGSGGPKIYLSTNNGDVRIKKGPAFPSAPANPDAGNAPSLPPSSRHLRTNQPLPQHPVTQ
jgi:DUF4097 and DUF4098 domain-containing protein YvlB